MPGLDESPVLLDRAEVVSVASQADIAVGAHGENCDFLDAEEISRNGFELSDLTG